MCIIFLHSDPDCLSSSYKLILAANRDEHLSRPSKSADFLSENPNVLCGLDLKPGYEGGTWLGVTRNGKFAALTNYLHSEKIIGKVSRGFIVRDYLESDSPVRDYINTKLINGAFSPFNFIGGQLVRNGNEMELFYYANNDPSSPRPLQTGNYSMACTTLGGKWNKCVHGSQVFERIIQSTDNHGPLALSDLLIDMLLSDTTLLYPDPAIEEQNKYGFNEKTMRSYCSVMIDGLEHYGTRAQTVILVDQENRLYFTEKSLTVVNGEKTWNYASFDFPLNLSS
ncbi:transport and Golgi organization 2 homolog [Clavelina lepadiformis]|uniref:Transport and Golgi organization protein 2 homolog n=1 Tax=Clavelina lepadiformis TaxID=159417 RepID=A0ABP0FNZ3_CLALP